MSATPDSTLADPKDHLIADLQRQLTECRAERDEAIAQQTATAEVLQVINSSPGELAPVFDAMLEKAFRLCDGVQGSLLTFDSGRPRLAAARGLSAEFVEVLREHWERREPSEQHPVSRLMRGERVIQIPDMSASDFYRRGDPTAVAAVQLGQVRTVLFVALVKDDAPVGVFVIARREVRAFSDNQIALVQNFAAQAVIAIENARLLTETREALEQQTATAEVLQVINSSPGDLAPVFEAMLEKATRLCEAPFGTLRTWDGERFHFGAVYGDRQLSDWVRRRGSFRPDGGPLRRIMEGEQVVQIADASSDPLYSTSAGFREMVEASGMRSGIAVALRKDETLLGSIHVYRQEVRPFSNKQIALLQNFAAQAVIAMENARLLNETREALEQQTATAEVLGVINSSPGDLAPVFEAILEKTLRLCEAVHGNFLTYDGEVFHQTAFRGEPQFAEYRRQQGPLRPNHRQLARVVQGGGTLHRVDAREDEAYRHDPQFRQMVDGLGIRTSLAVPLRKGDALLGIVRAYRREVRPFTDKQIALVESFAAQAVIAMENARLLDELRQRTSDLEQSLEYQTATSDVLNVISRSTADVQPVLDTVAETAARLCGADTALITIREGEVYRFVASSFSAAEPELWTILSQRRIVPGRQTVHGRVALEGRVVHIADILADSDYAAPETVRAGRRTMLGVPLLREGAVIGTISLGRKRVEPFTERQIELVRTFADQAVIAIENARLLGELRQRTDEVAELNRGLEARVAEQVDELGRVGRLKRFLAPQLAELIVSHGDEKILESHRREIVVVFCDLRGYTAFTETAEPEEVLEFLRQYHGALGPLVSQYEGTLDQFSGDGIMVFFNDPVPCPDPAERAVTMAMAMREEAGKLIATWRHDGCELGFGAGIAQGFATLGQIGFSERSGYTAIGTVCNLAARLCAEAKDGQILISGRVARAVKAVVKLEDLGNLELRGLRRPVAAFNVVHSTSAADARPNLTVVTRGAEA